MAETHPVAGVLRRLFGGFRFAYLPVLATYFCYGASALTGVALLYFQKETLGLTPAEAAMFAIMASLMNLALSASELFTQYLNTGIGVTERDYSNLGRLMITVGIVGQLPLLALLLLWREELPPGTTSGGTPRPVLAEPAADIGGIPPDAVPGQRG